MVDSSNLEGRAKADRRDGGKPLTLTMRYYCGERDPSRMIEPYVVSPKYSHELHR